MEPLPRSFYEKEPDEVAEKLLGKLLVRLYEGRRLSGIIVETEAYYGELDPASRASRRGGLAKIMRGEAGMALVYGIHGRWLFNVVAHKSKGIGGVLIRALKPMDGLEVMMNLRGTRNVELIASGPGRLTQAMAINKWVHGKPVYIRAHGLWIEDMKGDVKVARSRRVGVTEDLPIPLRFYVEGCPYVSKVRSSRGVHPS